VRAADERGALDRPRSLFEHATRLHEQHPTAPLPRGGRPYPDEGSGCGSDSRATAADRKRLLKRTLTAFWSNPAAPVQALHDDLSYLDLPGWIVESVMDKHRTPDVRRTHDTGVWLVRHGTDRRAVMVGLALLARTGRPDDAALVRMIGLLDLFGPMAAAALAALPDATPDLIWLAERSQRWARIKAVETLCGQADPEAVAWLRRHAVTDEEMSASLARRIAESGSLADALDAPVVEDEVLDQAGQLLLAMVTPNDYRAQLAAYRDARRVYHALAHRFVDAPASMPRYAMLASLIEDLRSGYAACLDWDPGQRENIVAALGTILRRRDWNGHLTSAASSRDPRIRRRADWAQHCLADAVSPPPEPTTASLFRVKVVVPDPFRRSDVQTRILVDHRPVVAAAFDKGPPFPPETLCSRGQLRADNQPREVRLAEAHCTEGCCGALYVTIVRNGDTVVWRDWRGHTTPTAPPELRFGAAQYDAEIESAETDHSWEWPARTVARLLQERLDAEPDLLTRWQCHPGYIWASPDDPTRLRFSFIYAPRPKPTDDEPWLQFEHAITIDDTPATHQADRLAGQLETADPRTHAAVVGGSPRDHAERLGYRPEQE
jgi:hypothetical protein